MGLNELSGCYWLRNGATAVSVLPARGSLVATLSVRGVEFLFLDPATLASAHAPVRGGIPILFPIAGELVNHTFLPFNTTMRRHGFGRDKTWQLIECADTFLSTRLDADEDTRRQYPFVFAVTQTVRALGSGISIEIAIENHDEKILPVAPGWHPYFVCPSAAKAAVLAQVLGIDAAGLHGASAIDINVPAPQHRRVTFVIESVGRISIHFCEALRTMQIWTQPNKDFVCVEPVLGPANTINTPSAATVEPGDRRVFWMHIECQPFNAL